MRVRQVNGGPVAALLVGAGVCAAGAALCIVGCLFDPEGDLRQGWDGAIEQDSDGDGVPDDSPDNCPTTPNRAQADFDDDDVGNACDTDAVGADSDGDGLDDSIDQCVGTGSGTNEEGDQYVFAPLQIVDGCDNCPCVPNGDQRNGDMDDIGDACEAPGEEALLRNIVFFDGMRDDSMGWRLLGWDGWGFQSGALKATPSTVIHAIVPDFVAVGARTRFGIETTMRFEAEGAVQIVRGGIVAGSELDAARTRLERWTACVVAIDPLDGMSMSLELRSLTSACTEDWCAMGDLLRQEPLSGVVWEAGTSWRLYVVRDGNRVSCHVGDTAADPVVSVVMTVGSIAAGGPGLTAGGGASAAVEFLRAAVYTP